MSAPGKLRGKSPGESESEVTRLKKLWRDSLSETDRLYWCSLFSSDTRQELIREEIFTKLAVRLKRDGQLTAFRQWVRQEQGGLAHAAAICMEESKKFPDVQQLFRIAFDMLKRAKTDKEQTR